MLTRKQSWVMPCIEAKVLPIIEDYTEGKNTSERLIATLSFIVKVS